MVKKVTNYSTYGLIIFMIIVPFEYLLYDLFGFSIVRYISLLTMFLALLDIAIKKSFIFDSRSAFMLLWLLFGIISFFWVKDQNRFVEMFSIYFNNTMMFVLISMVRYNKYEGYILKISIVAGLVCLLMYMTFVPNAITMEGYQNRLTLLLPYSEFDQNYLASLMIVPFGIIIHSLLNKENSFFMKVIKIVICLTILIYVLLTGSRTGLIAIIVILFMSFNTSWKNRLIGFISFILIIAVLFNFLIPLLPSGLLDRFSISAFLGQEHESASRLLLWKAGIESLNGFNIIYGYGIGSSFTITANSFLKYGLHNHYLALLVEQGIIGFSLNLIPIIYMTKKIFKYDKSLFASFIGILVVAFFLDVLTTKFFWASMMLLSVVISGYKNEMR